MNTPVICFFTLFLILPISSAEKINGMVYAGPSFMFLASKESFPCKYVALKLKSEFNYSRLSLSPQAIFGLKKFDESELNSNIYSINLTFYTSGMYSTRPRGRGPR